MDGNTNFGIENFKSRCKNMLVLVSSSILAKVSRDRFMDEISPLYEL